MCDKRKNLFDKVFTDSWWSKQSNFPPCDEWKANIEKHLRFMLEKSYLPSIENQLRSRNFESFLSEIFAAYFVEKNLGFELTGWNPSTKEGRDVEFHIRDKTGGEIFCEVKSPGWKGQLTREEINSGRSKQRKYSTFGEARCVEPYRNIRRVIDKSYEKFLSDKKNLLIITDNFFQPLPINPRFNPELIRKIPWDIYIALYNDHDDVYGGKGYFRTVGHEYLSGILFLNDRYLGKFFAWFEFNPNARILLSKEFVLKALKMNDELIEKSESL